MRSLPRITLRMDAIAPLLDRTLILVAHPDDEAVACGGLLQRMSAPLVVFATDGAPRDEFFWKQYGSREDYARIRREEAVRALHAVGVDTPVWLNGGGFLDQELFRSLPQALAELCSLARQHRASAILTLAYEGGHPDHDACSALGFALGRDLAIPVCEAPLYHAAPGTPVRQQFITAAAVWHSRLGCAEERVQLTPAELDRKRTMWAAYSSQATTLQLFEPALERLRPQPVYDYTQPPHPGALNYELWQWPITGREVAAACTTFLRAAFGTTAAAAPSQSGAA